MLLPEAAIMLSQQKKITDSGRRRKERRVPGKGCEDQRELVMLWRTWEAFRTRGAASELTM